MCVFRSCCILLLIQKDPFFPRRSAQSQLLLGPPTGQRNLQTWIFTLHYIISDPPEKRLCCDFRILCKVRRNLQNTRHLHDFISIAVFLQKSADFSEKSRKWKMLYVYLWLIWHMACGNRTKKTLAQRKHTQWWRNRSVSFTSVVFACSHNFYEPLQFQHKVKTNPAHSTRIFWKPWRDWYIQYCFKDKTDFVFGLLFCRNMLDQN